jgi:hypothetical protein
MISSIVSYPQNYVNKSKKTSQANKMKFFLFGFIILCFLAACTATRSQTAKNDFKVQHPCPANGNRKGPCPGYVIDHIKPLACGGSDDPDNMQWQTLAEGKAKDKWERKNCF